MLDCVGGTLAVVCKSQGCHCDNLDRPAGCWNPMHGETAASSDIEAVKVGSVAELLRLLVVHDGLALAYCLSKVRCPHFAFFCLAPGSIDCQAYDAHRFNDANLHSAWNILHGQQSLCWLELTAYTCMVRVVWLLMYCTEQHTLSVLLLSHSALQISDNTHFRMHAELLQSLCLLDLLC